MLYFLYLFLKWRWGFDELSEFMSKKEKTHILHSPWFRFKHKSSSKPSYWGVHSSYVFLEKQATRGQLQPAMRPHRVEVDIQLWSLECWLVGASRIYIVLKCSDVNSSCFEILTALLTRMCLKILELAFMRNSFHVKHCFENYGSCWVCQNLSAAGEIKALSLCVLRYL